MALIYNASEKMQEFRVFGSYFTMKPGQIKTFQDHMARWIVLNLKYLGLVDLPEEIEDVDFRQSPEGKAIIEDKRKEGVNARVSHLREVIQNLQVSLKKDLDMANLKMDPRALASDGEVAAYEELAKYQASKADEEQKKLARLKEIEEKLKGAI